MAMVTPGTESLRTDVIPALPLPSPHRYRPVWLFCLASAGFLAGTAYFTRPLLTHMATSAVDRGDYLLTTYIQAWGTHSFLSHPLHIFNMNMLYPAKHVMAASENLLGNQLI